MISLIVILLLCHMVSSIQYAPIVKIDSGQVRGIIVKLDDNSDVYLYEGIRYGQAKRFKKARFADSWNGIYDAIKWRDACPQPMKHVNNNSENVDIGFSTKTMSEDCLYLNVWKPSKMPQQLLPVMVWIHGGEFTTGTIFDNAFDARYMAEMGKVVVVSINYRLGPFGFLYIGNEDAPGNQGLHDQILALKWIKKNIINFGGDPNQVTIFGESAGSMSIGALLLSPLTKNLFKRAILQSGAPNSYIGSTSKEKALKKTFILAEKLNCYQSNMSYIIECLRTKTIEQILEACKDDVFKSRLMIPIYGDELMPIRPVEALKNKQFNPVDLMFGVTRNEGSGFVVKLIPFLNPDIKHPNITLSMVKTTIGLMMLFVNETYGQQVVEFYTKNLNASNQNDLRIAIADAFGDYHLVCPTILYGEYFARASKNNFYSYRLMLPILECPFSCKGWEGVCHGEDVVYLFVIPNNRTSYNKEEIQLSNDMIKSWTKFAHTGHPGTLNCIQWNQALDHHVVNTSVDIMSLDPKNYNMIKGYFKVKCDQFWKEKIFI